MPPDPDGPADPSVVDPAGPRLGRPLRWPTWLPAARVVWIGLVVLSGYGVWFLGDGLGVASLTLLVPLATIVDLGFQRARFDRLRFPDSALATALFLAVLLPPVVPLVAAGAVTVAAITIKHTLRYRGRPVLNPAATGMVLGALLFGTAPAWWGSISLYLLLAVGFVIAVRQWRNWRLPVVFIVAYAFLSILYRWLEVIETGSTIVPRVLLLTALDPSILFFALLIVPEPRTAPADRRAQPVYAAVVAAGAAFLPAFLPTLGVFVALFAGNLVSVGLRRRAPTGEGIGMPWRRRFRARQPLRAPARSGATTTARWNWSRRAVTGVLILLLVAWVAASTYSPSATPAQLLASRPGGSSGGGGVVTSVCQNDNQSIPSGTLSSLHKSLGPSVVLSYNSRTGVVVFYDPVNAVTVTETDLYEDYGFAEFNGDDYATAGCVPNPQATSGNR